MADLFTLERGIRATADASDKLGRLETADILREAADALAAQREALTEWLTRYGQILGAADKLLHEIRFASNPEELWRMVGMSQEVEDLHNSVIYEADAVEKTALSASPEGE